MGTNTQQATFGPTRMGAAVVEESLGTLSRGLLSRGLLAVAYGLVLLVWPGPTVGILMVLFGAYAIVDGSVALWTAAKAAPGERWPSVIQGGASVVAGIVGVVWPGISALALLYVIGGWAMVKGIVEFATAVRRPVFVEHPVLLGTSGVLAMAFSVMVFVHPGAGALAVVTLIALLALAGGTSLIVTSIQLSRTRHHVHAQINA
jgi:uncharacterized membrane protein HdeD (DUF308 family)